MSTASEYRKLLVTYLPRPIRSEHEYRRAMALLEQIMTPHPSAAESQLIELLSTLVESYEAQTHPTPQGSPGKTLKHLLDVRSVKCSRVAKETGIPAATLSNVLAGRRSISKANSVKLGGFFGVSPAVFLEDEDEPRVGRGLPPFTKSTRKAAASGSSIGKGKASAHRQTKKGAAETPEKARRIAKRIASPSLK